MKRQGIISDFIFQVFALIISVILVHAVYVAVIRPNADAILTQQATLQAADPEFVAPVSIYIVLRDLEQESCLMLMLWAVAIMGLKIHRNRVENKLLDRQLLPIADGMSILPQDVRDFARPLQALPPEEREFLLPRVLLSALQRFGITRSVPDACTVVV